MSGRAIIDQTHGRPYSRFRENLISIFKSSFVTQLLPVLTLPLITRLYTPEDFGRFSLFMVTIAIMIPIACLRLDWYTPNTQTQRQAVSLICFSLRLVVIVSLLTWAVLALFPCAISGLDKIAFDDIPTVFYPAALLSACLYALLQSWFIKTADLIPVSRGRVYQSLTTTGFQIALGILGVGVFGLAFGFVIGVWIGCYVLWRRAPRLTRRFQHSRLRFELLVYRRYASESAYGTATSLLSSLSAATLPMALAFYYSPLEVGWYAMMYRLAMFPTITLSTVIGQSFWAEASDRARENPSEVRALFLLSAKRLFVLALLATAIALAGPTYIGLVFGAEWAHAGSILAAMAPMMLGQMVAAPITHLVVHGKQYLKFRLDLALFVTVLATTLLCATMGTPIVPLVWIVSIEILLFQVAVFYLNLRCYRGA